MMPLRFLLKLGLFLIPVALVVGAPLALAVYMGEAMPISHVVAMQLGDEPVLYGPTDRETIFAYKLASVQARDPDVLFIGSSRLLQCREWLLNRDPDAFYNAGGEGWTLREIRALVEHLDADSTPPVMIVGLDQPWFNAEYVDWEPVHTLYIGDGTPQRALAAARRVLDDVLAGEVELSALLDRQGWVRGATGLGLNALRFGRGYRNDGSHQEGDLLVNPELGELGRTHDLDAADDDWRQYVEGNRVDADMLQELVSFLNLARERGITVIGVSPPFMPSIYEMMIENGEHEYLPRSADRLENVFRRNGFAYYDFSNAAWVNGTDEELYDGWHPSEKLCLRMYIHILREQPDILSPYSDLAYLESLLSQAHNPLEVIGG